MSATVRKISVRAEKNTDGAFHLKRNKLQRNLGKNLEKIVTLKSAGVHVEAVLTSLNTAFLPISRSHFKQR